MAHLNTELLTDYWRARLPPFGSPPRSSIDPTEFLDLLPQVFILGRAAAGSYSFRLVGGLVAELHGRSLQAEPFLPLWMSPDRAALQSAMEGAVRRSQPLVVEASGRATDGRSCDMEILLAPMAGASGAVDRFLGFYQPVGPLAQAWGRVVPQLAVRKIAAAGDSGQPLAEAPRLRLAALDGRRIA